MAISFRPSNFAFLGSFFRPQQPLPGLQTNLSALENGLAELKDRRDRMAADGLNTNSFVPKIEVMEKEKALLLVQIRGNQLRAAGVSTPFLLQQEKRLAAELKLLKNGVQPKRLDARKPRQARPVQPLPKASAQEEPPTVRHGRPKPKAAATPPPAKVAPLPLTKVRQTPVKTVARAVKKKAPAKVVKRDEGIILSLEPGKPATFGNAVFYLNDAGHLIVRYADPSMNPPIFISNKKLFWHQHWHLDMNRGIALSPASDRITIADRSYRIQLFKGGVHLTPLNRKELKLPPRGKIRELEIIVETLEPKKPVYIGLESDTNRVRFGANFDLVAEIGFNGKDLLIRTTDSDKKNHPVILSRPIFPHLSARLQRHYQVTATEWVSLKPGDQITLGGRTYHVSFKESRIRLEAVQTKPLLQLEGGKLPAHPALQAGLQRKLGVWSDFTEEAARILVEEGYEPEYAIEQLRRAGRSAETSLFGPQDALTIMKSIFLPTPRATKMEWAYLGNLSGENELKTPRCFSTVAAKQIECVVFSGMAYSDNTTRVRYYLRRTDESPESQKSFITRGGNTFLIPSTRWVKPEPGDLITVGEATYQYHSGRLNLADDLVFTAPSAAVPEISGHPLFVLMKDRPLKFFTEAGAAWVAEKGFKSDRVLKALEDHGIKLANGLIGLSEIKGVFIDAEVPLSPANPGPISIGSNPGRKGVKLSHGKLAKRQAAIGLTPDEKTWIRASDLADVPTFLVRNGFRIQVPVNGWIVLLDGDLLLFGDANPAAYLYREDSKRRLLKYPGVLGRWPTLKDEQIAGTCIPEGVGGARWLLTDSARALILQEGLDAEQVLDEILHHYMGPLGQKPVEALDRQMILDYRRNQIKTHDFFESNGTPTEIEAWVDQIATHWLNLPIDKKLACTDFRKESAAVPDSFISIYIEKRILPRIEADRKSEALHAQPEKMTWVDFENQFPLDAMVMELKYAQPAVARVDAELAHRIDQALSSIDIRLHPSKDTMLRKLMLSPLELQEIVYDMREKIHEIETKSSYPPPLKAYNEEYQRFMIQVDLLHKAQKKKKDPDEIAERERRLAEFRHDLESFKLGSTEPDQAPHTQPSPMVYSWERFAERYSVHDAFEELFFARPLFRAHVLETPIEQAIDSLDKVRTRIEEKRSLNGETELKPEKVAKLLEIVAKAVDELEAANPDPLVKKYLELYSLFLGAKTRLEALVSQITQGGTDEPPTRDETRMPEVKREIERLRRGLLDLDGAIQTARNEKGSNGGDLFDTKDLMNE